MDWLQTFITIFIALTPPIIATIWAIWTWKKQKELERDKEEKRLSALYINPFLTACEDLQSRIYNIIEKGGLPVIKSRHPQGEYAEETLYLIAQYFGWERCISRYGPYTHDQFVLETIEKIRNTFSTDSYKTRAFCFFRTEQKVLGHFAVKRCKGEYGFEFETASFYEFMDDLSKKKFNKIIVPLTDPKNSIEQNEVKSEYILNSILKTINALRKAKNASSLDGKERLADVQNYLVDLLSYIEDKEGFSLFSGKRLKAKSKPD
jgi:hypothetical protein